MAAHAKCAVAPFTVQATAEWFHVRLLRGLDGQFGLTFAPGANTSDPLAIQEARAGTGLQVGDTLISVNGAREPSDILLAFGAATVVRVMVHRAVGF